MRQVPSGWWITLKAVGVSGGVCQGWRVGRGRVRVMSVRMYEVEKEGVGRIGWELRAVERVRIGCELEGRVNIGWELEADGAGVGAQVKLNPVLGQAVTVSTMRGGPLRPRGHRPER